MSVYNSAMSHFLKVVVMLGVIIWIILLWDRAQPENKAREVSGKIDDATVTDRCAEFRQDAPDDLDADDFSLGYGGRINQFLHGCF